MSDTRRIALLSAAIAACLVTPALAQPNALGINIAAPLDWERNRAFADVMKVARDWTLPGSDELAPLDAKGWPTVDAQCVVWHGIDQMHGTYRLSFTGKATVSLEWAPAVIRNQTYDPATNTTTAEVDYTDPTAIALLIRFTDTGGVGVKNVRLMRPLAPGSNQSYPPSALFTDQFKNALAPFSTIRFMDFAATNWNQQQTWGDRVLPDVASFHRLPPDYGWQGKGAAWEYVIALANEAHKDAWICIPAHADDEYVRNLALLLRDGSAGWPGLAAGRKLYVEYSNEVWNWGFEQASYNDAQATAELNNGDPYGYNYDGQSWAAAWRRVARKIADISLIFRSVFGEAQMMTRVRPVFCWQAVYEATGHEPLKYLEDAYIPRFAPGRSVPDLLYGGGGSAYYSPDNESDQLTLDNIWRSQAMNTYHWGKEGPDAENPGRQVYNAELCRSFGLARVAYEGGPSLDNTGHSEEVKAQAVQDDRMRDAVVRHHASWSRWSGDLLAYFTLTHDYQWGFSSDVLGPETPKTEAIQELAAAPTREAVAIGNVVPSTVDGNAFDLGFYAWDTPGAGPRDVLDGRWYSYLFAVPVSALFEVSASLTDTSGSAVLLLDGLEVLAEALPSGGAVTISRVLALPRGLHSLRVKARGGRFRLNTVTLAPSALVDLQPPSAPSDLAARRVTETQAELTWTAASDDVAVSGYQVYRNDVRIATVPGPAYTDLSAPSGTAYRYFVVAFDLAGHMGPPSDTVELPAEPIVPADLAVDMESLSPGSSNANGVLEPGEGVILAPSWGNQGLDSTAATGSVSEFTSSVATAHTIADSTADYGSIPAGGQASCQSEADCYGLVLGLPAARPLHWDASVTETLSGGASKVWTLHVGGSFSDVPSSRASYRFVETLLHRGIVGGCGATSYCPSATVTRRQMAVFRAMAMTGADVPVSGTVGATPYNCVAGGVSAFADVPPTDAGCRFIHYIAGRGVTGGCGGGNYCPAASVDRRQMAIFLAGASSSGPIPTAGFVPGVGSYDCTQGGVSLFADIAASDPGCRFVHDLYARGVTAGCGGGNYCPSRLLDREQMAVFLTRGFELTLYGL